MSLKVPKIHAGARWLRPLLLAGVLACAARAQQQPSPPPPTADETAATPPPRPVAPARSTVVAVHDNAVVERYSVNPVRVRAMVDRLVAAATDQPDAGRGWRSLVSSADIVGIKIAASRGAAASTHRAVVLAVVESLIAAGHPRERILVWDRDPDELRLAGFLPERGSAENVFVCPVAFIAPRVGYDPKATYVAPALGKLIWGDLEFQGAQSPLAASVAALHQSDNTDPAAGNAGGASPAARGSGNRRSPGVAAENLSDTSHLCNLLSKRVTKVINLPTMSDSVFAGVAGALYNVTIPDIDNWRRLTGEPRWGNPYIVDLYSDPRVGGRVVLNIMDGLLAQYAGGPVFQPLYSRHHGTLYASRDPVALDAVAVRYLELWRAQRDLPPLGKATDHVRTAAESGLGNYAAEKIDLRNVSP